MKLNTKTRLGIAAALTALMAVLIFTDTLPPRYTMVVVGITLMSIAAVLLLIRAAKVAGQREAVPSLLWALAMLAGIGAFGWDMRLLIPMGVLSVAGAVMGKKYHVAL